MKSVSKGIIRCVIDCLVFGTLSYLLLVLFTDKTFVIIEFVKSGFFTQNWFVVAYIMLLLIAPIIEVSLKHVSQSQLLVWILLLSIFNLYFGYYLGNINSNGYNVIQFVWLYYIARFLRLSIGSKWQNRLSHYGIYIYVLSSALLASIFIGASRMGYTINSIRWFSYNNPILMLAAISLFMWVSKMSFKSNIVNLIATGVFGVFLLHTTPYVQPYRNVFTYDIYSMYGYSGIIIESIILFVILCVISIWVNKMNRPIINFICCKLFTKK